MKIRILRVCVLLVSLSAASVLVWNATRDQKPIEAKESKQEDKISPKKMQGSSKVRVIIDSDNIKEITQPEAYEFLIGPDSGSAVTDEDVTKMREVMLSTSKSGRVMSDDQIREMLEDRKKVEPKHEKEQRFMPSSKSIDAVLRPEDVEKIIKRDASDFINPVEPEK